MIKRNNMRSDIFRKGLSRPGYGGVGVDYRGRKSRNEYCQGHGSRLE